MKEPAFRYFTEVHRDGTRARHKLVRHRGFGGYWVQWTQACSGCSDDDVGGGCHECGYTGKRRVRWFVPLDHEAWEQHHQRVWDRYQRMLARKRAA